MNLKLSHLIVISVTVIVVAALVAVVNMHYNVTDLEVKKQTEVEKTKIEKAVELEKKKVDLEQKKVEQATRLERTKTHLKWLPWNN